MIHLTRTISELGNIAMLLPLSLIVTGMVWRFQSGPAAAWFVAAVVLCVTAMAALKVAFLACSQAWGTHIVSPSGHASLSAAIYGSIVVVVARQVRPWQQPLVIVAGWAVIVAVAISRVILGAHSPAEVLVGVAVGTVACTLFAVPYLRRPVRPLSIVLLLVLTITAVLLLHGIHLHTEHTVRRIAAWLTQFTTVCARN